MSKEEKIRSRRTFLEDFLRETVKLAAEFKKNFDEGKRLAQMSATFADLPIISTYPREFFEEEARRLGIDIDKIGEKEAIKHMVMKQLLEQSDKS